MMLARRGVVAALVIVLLAGCGSPPSTARPAPSDAGPEAEAAVPGFWTARTPVTSLDLLAVWGSGSELYAAGRGGVIVRSADDGDTWSVSRPGDAQALFFPAFYAIWGSGPGDVYVGGADREQRPLVAHSADHGQSWQPLAAALPGIPQKIWGSGPQDVYVAVAPGGVVHSSDGGRTWQTVYGDGSTHGTGVWGSSAGDVYAVGWTTEPAAAPSPDGGSDAASVDGGVDAGDAGEPPAGSGDGGEVARGFVVHSTDGGHTWSAVTSAPFVKMLDISGSADGTGVSACGAQVTQVLTIDHGASWYVSTSAGFDVVLYRIWCPPHDSDVADCWMVSDQGLLANITIFDGGPIVWTVAELPPIFTSRNGSLVEESTGPSAVWGTSLEDVWVVGAAGAIWHGGL